MGAARVTRRMAPVVFLLVTVFVCWAGSVVRAEVPTSISKAVTSYLDSLQRGEYDQAYKMLSRADRDRLPHDEWVEASSRRVVGGARGPNEMPQEMLPVLLLSMGDAVIGETEVKGDQASTLVEIKADLPLKLCLVKEGEEWLIDLQRSDQSQVAAMTRRLVDSIRGKAMGDWAGPQMMMGIWSGMMAAFISTGGLQRYVQDYEVISATIEGDHAVAEIAQHASLKKLVCFKRAGGSWVFDLERTFAPEGAVVGAEGGPAAQTQCVSNLKQIGMAMMMYAEDHDGQLPVASEWCNELMPYLKNENVFKCPAAPDLECGYAMNFKLSKVNQAEIAHPDQVVLLFESSMDRPNANDDGKTWTPRHNGGGAVLYVDGHVKMVNQKPDCRWQRQTAPKPAVRPKP